VQIAAKTTIVNNQMPMRLALGICDSPEITLRALAKGGLELDCSQTSPLAAVRIPSPVSNLTG